MNLYPNLIKDALKTVRYPGSGKNLVEADMIADNMRIDGMSVSFSIVFEKDTDPFKASILKAAEKAIHTYVSPEVQVAITAESKQAPRPEVGMMLPAVKNIIGVSSGKGGVGKSTVAANLAVALSRMGFRVGLLDADIFGPSIPKMFQVEETQVFSVHKDGRDLILPVEKYGVKLLSIGFFVDPDQATLWRGGMASNALKQLIFSEIQTRSDVIRESEAAMLKSMKGAVESRQKQSQAGTRQEIAILQHRIRELTDATAELYEARFSGTIGDDAFQEQMQRQERERMEKQAQLDTLVSELDTANRQATDTERWKRLIHKYAQLQDLDREAVEEMIDFIEIDKTKTVGGKRIRNIIVHYRFAGRLPETK